MNVSRRNLIKGAAAIGVVPALPIRARARGRSVVIADTRLSEAKAFADAGRRAGARVVDLAVEHQTRWAALRALSPQVAQVAGLTNWSDFVSARGVLEDRGFRVTEEAIVAPRKRGPAQLFRWRMDARA